MWCGFQTKLKEKNEIPNLNLDGPALKVIISQTLVEV